MRIILPAAILGAIAAAIIPGIEPLPKIVDFDNAPIHLEERTAILLWQSGSCPARFILQDDAEVLAKEFGVELITVYGKEAHDEWENAMLSLVWMPDGFYLPDHYPCGTRAERCKALAKELRSTKTKFAVDPGESDTPKTMIIHQGKVLYTGSMCRKHEIRPILTNLMER